MRHPLPALALAALAAMAGPAARGPLRGAEADLAAGPPPLEMPRTARPDLAVELFLREPDIATPIALEVDGEGRVWVIESNTHFQLRGYTRHPTDRVLIVEDRDGDGRGEAPSVFADGLQQSMALALSGEGRVLLATRREVLLLEDADHDGRADRRQVLARLDTAEQYPHNGLSGFAVDALGSLYFAIGENMGVPYCLTGSDGAMVSGGPEGGSIFRMRADGAELERWATGFWNTFHLAFDAFGRLFAVDNDPDSRPPCRLLHIVRGGDYGYRRWLGRKGLHPFTSWNGEAAGTLPMVAGTGEAPSGILAYEHEGLPGDLHGTLLVTSWGDHRIECHRLEPRGASVRSRMEVLVAGGESFRPVGIAVAPDGSVYFSDWVLKDYPVHGRGRLWRLRGVGVERPAREPSGSSTVTGPGADDAGLTGLLGHPVRQVREEAASRLAGLSEGGRLARQEISTPGRPARARLEALVVLARRGDLDPLDLDLLRGEPPEVRAAAVRLLAAPRRLPAPVLRGLLLDAEPAVRLEALLALPAGGPGREPALRGREALEALDPLLAESDPFLFAAAVEALGRAATGHPAGVGVLLEARGSPEARKRLGLVLALRRSGEESARQGLPGWVEDPDPQVRRAAVQWIGEEKLIALRSSLDRALEAGPPTPALLDAFLAAVGLLAGETPEGRDAVEREAFLLRLAADSARPASLRAQALRCIPPSHPGLTLGLLKSLLAEEDRALALEALRSLGEGGSRAGKEVLRERALDARQPLRLRREALTLLTCDPEAAGKVLPSLLLAPEPLLRQEAERARRWMAEDASIPRDPAAPGAPPGAEILEGGDPSEGEIIFNHPRGPRCSECHTVGGRGGAAGPDLSAAGLSPPARLLEAILEPAREVSPQYALWVVETDQGLLAGTVLEEAADGSLALAIAGGKIERLPAAAVRARHPAEGSLMPQGLTSRLTPGELRDLLAYLRAQR